MKAKTTIFSMALLIAFLLLGCSNDENFSGSSSPVPKAPSGAKTQYLYPGSTVSQIRVDGTSVRWYLNLSDTGVNSFQDFEVVEINNLFPMAILTPDYPVRNNTTYYATQTVNGIQSHNFLAVKVYWLEGF